MHLKQFAFLDLDKDLSTIMKNITFVHVLTEVVRNTARNPTTLFIISKNDDA